MLINENELLHSMSLACFLEFDAIDYDHIKNIKSDSKDYILIKAFILYMEKKEIHNIISNNIRVIESLKIIKLSQSILGKFRVKSIIEKSNYSGIRKVLELR